MTASIPDVVGDIDDETVIGENRIRAILGDIQFGTVLGVGIASVGLGVLMGPLGVAAGLILGGIGVTIDGVLGFALGQVLFVVSTSAITVSAVVAEVGLVVLLITTDGIRLLDIKALGGFGVSLAVLGGGMGVHRVALDSVFWQAVGFTALVALVIYSVHRVEVYTLLRQNIEPVSFDSDSHGWEADGPIDRTGEGANRETEVEG